MRAQSIAHFFTVPFESVLSGAWTSVPPDALAFGRASEAWPLLPTEPVLSHPSHSSWLGSGQRAACLSTSFQVNVKWRPGTEKRLHLQSWAQGKWLILPKIWRHCLQRGRWEGEGWDMVLSCPPTRECQAWLPGKNSGHPSSSKCLDLPHNKLNYGG